ncbi:MAG: threonine--tRNA ligase [Gammaproteobacteria bacterium]
MKTVILADGNRREFDCATAAEVAAAIAPSLAKRAVACKINGILRDIAAPFADGDRLVFVSREDDDAAELIRHDCAHIMAQAVLQLFPDAQPTIGPVIDNGFYYDFDRAQPFAAADLQLIEKRMRDIVAQKIPLRREEWTREQALAHYQNQPYKTELVQAIPDGEAISFYRQGDFLDLCRGPHLRHTGDAGTAFKLMRVAGSYWRGDSKRPQLQRIYGAAFRTDGELQAHLKMLAEAEARDHRRLGRAMGLFHLQEEAAGMAFWHDKGWRLYRQLESYMRRRLEDAGYAEVKTPQLVERKLWLDSGHWQKFRQHMYIAENEEGLRDYAERPDEARIFALKPMNCPCHVQIYKQGVKSYRDLPLKMAEFGSCHRAEPSGALHGLLRARHFVQDDAHIFCTEEQIAGETAAFMELLRGIYKDLGFATFAVRFSDRPAERAGDDDVWDRAEAALREACQAAKVQWQLNPGEGAFYGPKLEFVLKDAIGREWQCGTWQVDFVLPERLGAEYTAANGERKRPVMCHRAIIGSFERFIGILLEHHNGRLPLWLAPVQVVAATITEAADDYAQEVGAALRAAGLRYETDTRNEKINYKVREHSEAKVPVILALGEREARQKAVSVRRIGSSQTIVKPLAAAVEELRAESTPPA